MKQHLHAPQLAAAALLLSQAGIAAAAETGQEGYIETIVVIGEREPGNLVLDADELNRTQATTLEDMFSNESTIAVGGGSPVAQKIYVRGFEDVMLNFTVDGAQSPGELYHHQSRLQLEPEFIKYVELDAGAGAATNGAGALTGAMRTTLKDAFDLLQPDQDFGAFLKGTGRFNGDDGEEYTGAVYGRLSERLGMVAGYSYQDRGNFEDGHGDVPGPSSYQRNRGFVKLSGSADAHAYSVSYENLADQGETFERPNLVNFGGTYEYSDQEMDRETFAVNYGYAPGSNWVELGVTVYYNNTDFRVQRQNSDIIYGEGDFESTGFDLRNSSRLGAHSVTYGLDFRTDEVTSAQNATPPFAWGDTEQSGSVTGLYMQDNWQIADTIELTFGARYDNYRFDGDGGVSDGVNISDSRVSPNVGISWEAIEGLTLRASYAEAFRGVGIREAFFSAIYVHTDDLKAETADNAELGIAWERNGYFARGTLYQQHIDNFIDTEFRGPFPVWGYWENVGDAKVEGYEAEVGRQAGNYFLSFGVWEADNTLNGEPLVDSNLGLGTTIGRTWLGRFRYDLNTFAANVGVDLRYVEEADNAIAPAAPPKDAYFVANLYADWQPTDRVTVALAVTNLLDEFYYDQATYTYIGGSVNDYVGYPSKGREIVASLAVRL